MEKISHLQCGSVFREMCNFSAVPKLSESGDYAGR